LIRESNQSIDEERKIVEGSKAGSADDTNPLIEEEKYTKMIQDLNHACSETM